MVYTEISLADSQDDQKFRYCPDLLERVHRLLLQYGITIYKMSYYDQNTLTPYYYLPTWVYKLYFDFKECAKSGSFSTEEAIEYTSYVCNDPTLKSKWCVVLTLNPSYLHELEGHRELREDLKSAGFSLKPCSLLWNDV